MPTYSFTPSKQAMAKDLVAQMVLAMLDSGSAALFTSGLQNPQPAGKVALFTGLMLPTPDDAAFIIADELENRSSQPLTTYDCQITIRSKGSATQSAQARADGIGKAIVQYLRPLGENRCNTQLPSGRRVLSFQNAKLDPIGQDVQERYNVAVTFRALCESDL